MLRLGVLSLVVVVAPVWAIDVATLEKSVVRIIAESHDGAGTGSGSVVANEFVLTNHHVIDGSSRLRAGSMHTGGNMLDARVVWASPDLDLAILRVNGLNLPTVQLATGKPGKSEEVLALGYPGVSDDLAHDFQLVTTVTKGVVSLIFSGNWGGSSLNMDIIQHTADINPGNSGGPLFDRCGRVVGVNTAVSSSARVQGALWASRITEAIPHLEQQGISLQKVGTPCTQSVTGLEDALRETAETARQAQAQAGEAQEQADVAQQKATQAAQVASQAQTHASEARQTAHFSIIMGVVIGALALLALVFALRKPRQQIIHAVERLSRPIREHLPAVNVLSRLGGGKPPALVLTGFDAAGKKLRIMVPAQGASAAEGGYVIGRHAALTDHAVEDASISRRHLRVLVENGQCQVEDINSTNGTLVNDIPLQAFEPHPLSQGDTVSLGTVELRVSD